MGGGGVGGEGVWIGSHSANATRGGNFGKSNFLYLLVRGVGGGACASLQNKIRKNKFQSSADFCE